MKSQVKLEGMQVKSLDKARKLAKALDIIEVECGIKSVRITVEDMFVCPGIDFSRFGKTPMEKLLKELLVDKSN